MFEIKAEIDGSAQVTDLRQRRGVLFVFKFLAVDGYAASSVVVGEVTTLQHCDRQCLAVAHQRNFRHILNLLITLSETSAVCNLARTDE